MKISELYKTSPVISFEIFPPKTENGLNNLWIELDKLSICKPGFISVTYGAGGSTRDKTLDIALNIKNNLNITPLIHFTCVGLNRNDIRSYINKISKHGIDNILALRGDPPAGTTKFVAPEDGFLYANELIEFIKAIDHFTIIVAGYPEGHVEAKDIDTDIDNLKKKIDAGGEVIITQLFFDNERFYKYMDKLTQKNIHIPVVPGIMPITNSRQLDRIKNTFGATIQDELASQLVNAQSDEEIIRIGITHSTKQCEELLSWGVPGIHFYPLNKAYALIEILKNLNLQEM